MPESVSSSTEFSFWLVNIREYYLALNTCKCNWSIFPCTIQNWITSTASVCTLSSDWSIYQRYITLHWILISLLIGQHLKYITLHWILISPLIGQYLNDITMHWILIHLLIGQYLREYHPALNINLDMDWSVHKVIYRMVLR